MNSTPEHAEIEIGPVFLGVTYASDDGDRILWTWCVRTPDGEWKHNDLRTSMYRRGDHAEMALDDLASFLEVDFQAFIDNPEKRESSDLFPHTCLESLAKHIKPDDILMAMDGIDNDEDDTTSDSEEAELDEFYRE